MRSNILSLYYYLLRLISNRSAFFFNLDLGSFDVFRHNFTSLLAKYLETSRGWLYCVSVCYRLDRFNLS